MTISLIGMSGIGKTHWSTQLRERGFDYFGCDDIIERKLGRQLTDLGYSGLNDISLWLGQPYDARYKENSLVYLEHEKESLDESLAAVAKDAAKNTVIDTTGSFIYLPKPMLAKLQRETVVVYLQAGKEHAKEMFDIYLKDPMPVIWGGNFTQRVGESGKTALKRCYPDMLAFREREYARWADIAIPFEEHRGKFSVDRLTEIAQHWKQKQS